MALGSNLAGVARVAFEAQTATFYAELASVETRYKATLARMEAAAARFNATTLQTAAPATLAGRTATAAPAPVRPPQQLSQTESAIRQREQRAQARGLGGGGAGAGIDKVTKSTQDYTKAATGATKATGEWGSAVARTRVGAVSMSGSIIRSTAAFGGMLLAANAVMGLARSLAEAQRVAAQTAAVIESTGGIAGVTAEHVDELALALQKESRFTDEAIGSGENMLLTFKNIRNVAGEGNDIFDQSTRVLVDMAAAFNKQTGSTDGLARMSIQLGKALNDPIKGITALGRVGVQFTEQEREKIKTLVESGKTMEAQKIILRELNSEFAGSAKAQASTFGGQLTVMMHQLEEAAETAANDLTPALLLMVGALKFVIRVLTPLKPIIVALTIAWALWKVQILLAHSAVLKAVGGFVLMTAQMIIQHGVIAGLRTAWLMLTAVMMANPIGAIVVALALLAGALYMAWTRSETFRRVVTEVFRVVAQLVVKYIGWILMQIDLFLAGLTVLTDAASHLPLVGDMFAGVSDKINGARESLDGLHQGMEDFVNKDWTVDFVIRGKTEGFAGGQPTFGITPIGETPGAKAPGEVAGGKTDAADRPDPTRLPGGLKLRESQARRNEDERALRKVLAEEKAYYVRRLRTEKLNKAERAQLHDAIGAIESETRQMDEDAQSERDARDKDRADKAKTAREKMMETPDWIKAGQARAARSDKNDKDDEKWLRIEMTFLRKRRRRLDLTLAEQQALDERLETVEDSLDQIREDRKARRAAAREAAAEREDLLLERAMARAELTPGIADDARVLSRMERATQARLRVLEKKKKLTNDELQEMIRLYGELKQIRDAKKELLQQNAKDESAHAAFLMDEFRRVTREFSSNVMAGGGPVGGNVATSGEGGATVPGAPAVTVVQNFNAPTTDRHREARLASLAVGAQFSG